MAYGDAGRNHGFGAYSDVMAHHGVARRLVGFDGIGKGRLLLHVEEGERGRPVVPVPLVARHDERGAAANRAKAADDELAHIAAIRHQIVRAVVKAVAVVVA